MRSEEHEVRFWHTHCGRRDTIALFLCAASPPTPCLPRRNSCFMPERGGLRPPPPLFPLLALRCTSCIDTSSAHAAPTRTRPRRGPRAMHMPAQVRMHACASEWPSVFLRDCASVCAANVSLCSVSRRAAHTPKHHTCILHFYHTEGTARPSLCSAAVCAKHTELLCLFMHN